MAVDPGNDTSLGDPQSWNKYAYVRNNPLNATDPTGEFADYLIDIPMAAISVAQAIDDPSVGNVVGAVLDVAAAAVPIVPALGGRLIDAGQAVDKAIDGAKAADTAADVGKAAGAGEDAAKGAGKVFSEEKQALVDMAQADKKTGMTADDMQAYKDLNAGLSDPFPADKVRGPESHPGRGPASQAPHGHVGPVHKIPIREQPKKP